MRKSDVTCPECGAGFRRIELTSEPGIKGQYHCPACSTVLEALDGNTVVAYRLTVVPARHLELWGQALSKATSHRHYSLTGRTQRLAQEPGTF